jgi:predicted Rossmann fold flavoprotein
LNKYDIAIVGGGAAGFFAAIRAAELQPGARIIILEKTTKWLSKVKVSGGGRCNVTHDCKHVSALVQQYPRGGKALKKLFSLYKVEDTIAWFAQRGIQLKVEQDGRIFPVSDSSQTIIDCFFREAQRLKIQLRENFSVEGIERTSTAGILLHSVKGQVVEARKALVATGGHPKASAYQWLEQTGHSLMPPVPSLFTFNSPKNPLAALAGVSVPQGQVRIEGTKLQHEGPVLITHWGFSGPAVLKLSAFGAEWAHQQDYHFAIQVRWVSEPSEEVLREQMQGYQLAHPKRLVGGHSLFDLPQRLWQHLCLQAEISETTRWTELPKKNFNKLVEGLFRDRQEVKGKTTYKEEFVTCGGIPLPELHLPRMESSLWPGLYFAGEVLNVDGITGGFNFQNAWTTGWLAGTHMAESKEE